MVLIVRVGGFIPLLVAATLMAGGIRQDRGMHALESSSKIPAEHLPNVVRLHPKVISGGRPEGDAGFAELKALGVKTVISVDGAKPDLALAGKHGLRYVHLPHGYDGVPANRAVELAKAVRDLPGSIYIHCHHGKHRSPAAAAVACVGAGLVTQEEGIDVLTLAGTSERYLGLFKSTERATPFERTRLDSHEIVLPEMAELPPMAEAMVGIEEIHDRLKRLMDDDWKAPPDHPDLEPVHEALLLREQFTELLRTEDVRAKPQAFRDSLQESEQALLQLEMSLRGKNASIDETGAKAAFLEITGNCTACHEAFRDRPSDVPTVDSRH